MHSNKLDSILLIDDDEIANFIYTKIIANTNISNNVKSLQSASEALEYLKNCYSDDKNPPEIIFLDINMPLMSGWDFLDHYQKLPEDIKSKTSIFMLSSSVYQEDLEKANSYKEVEDYITKPLTQDKLLEIKKKYF
ncbi:MAG: response regulator [Candidatus Cyclobacteriaceae bacterium M2_1C_046]